MEEIEHWRYIPDGGLFVAWAEARMASSSHKRRMTAESVGIYGFMWKRWIAECAREQRTWNKATSTQVSRFLAALSGAKRLKVAGGQERVASDATDVTRARYARALHEIYSFAVGTELIARNPVTRNLQQPRRVSR